MHGWSRRADQGRVLPLDRRVSSKRALEVPEPRQDLIDLFQESLLDQGLHAADQSRIHAQQRVAQRRLGAESHSESLAHRLVPCAQFDQRIRGCRRTFEMLAECLAIARVLLDRVAQFRETVKTLRAFDQIPGPNAGSSGKLLDPAACPPIGAVEPAQQPRLREAPMDLLQIGHGW